jgi:hypothetical protein
MRRSRRRVNGDRKTKAVCHRHELRTFAPLGLSHPAAPFLATTNVPSMKHSDRSRSPRTLRSAAIASSTLRSVPSRTHCWKQNPEYCVKYLTSIFPRPAAPVFTARRGWNKRLNDSPLFIS